MYLIHMPFTFVCDETTMTPVKGDDGNYLLNENNNADIWKVIVYKYIYITTIITTSLRS